MTITYADGYLTSGFKVLLCSHQILNCKGKPQDMAVRPKSACSSRGSVTSYLHWSYQTRFHPPLSTGANKPRKHLSCKSHCFFSCLLGMFPSCLSASPLLYEVSTRHFLPLHIPCLPAAGQASLQLTKSQNGSSSTTLHIHPCMTHQQTRRTSRMLG